MVHEKSFLLILGLLHTMNKTVFRFPTLQTVHIGSLGVMEGNWRVPTTGSKEKTIGLSA